MILGEKGYNFYYSLDNITLSSEYLVKFDRKLVNMIFLAEYSKLLDYGLAGDKNKFKKQLELLHEKLKKKNASSDETQMIENKLTEIFDRVYTQNKEK